jgi:hypothetical protein
VVFSQTGIEMDSTAIYVMASSDLVNEGVFRWRLAGHERRAFESGLVPNLMEWKWCDPVTGETLAPAIDESPELPELSRWMPTDSNITWEDLPPADGEADYLRDLFELGGTNKSPDCVLVYQYA